MNILREVTCWVLFCYGKVDKFTVATKIMAGSYK